MQTGESDSSGLPSPAMVQPAVSSSSELDNDDQELLETAHSRQEATATQGAAPTPMRAPSGLSMEDFDFSLSSEDEPVNHSVSAHTSMHSSATPQGATAEEPIMAPELTSSVPSGDEASIAAGEPTRSAALSSTQSPSPSLKSIKIPLDRSASPAFSDFDNDEENPAAGAAPSFRELLRKQAPKPILTSGAPPAGMRASSLSPRGSPRGSPRDSPRQSPRQSPRDSKTGSPRVSWSRGRGSISPSPHSDAGSGAGSPLQALPRFDGSGSSGSVSDSSSCAYAPKPSPLDHLDQLLATQAPASQPKPLSSSGRLPLRLGLLSFDEQGYEGLDSSSATRRAGTLFGRSGVRSSEERTRRLETENLELRLKLQQYREMNAGDQEITRMKAQIDRAERRIDELEQALERKNRTILELSEERDALASKARSDTEIGDLQETIMDLQMAITELEAQSTAAETAEQDAAAALAQARDVLSGDQQAGNKDTPLTIRDLVVELRKLHDENERLAKVQSAHDNLVRSLDKLPHHKRRHEEPVEVVQQLADHILSLQQKLTEAQDALRLEKDQQSRRSRLLHQSHQDEITAMRQSEAALKKELDRAHTSLTALESKIVELDSVVENQHKMISDTRAAHYGVIRQVFTEIIDVMGPDVQTAIEAELQKVIETAQAEGVSKLPLLTDLLLYYTRQVAEEALRSHEAPNFSMRMRAMEQEVQAMEHQLAMKLDKSGADAILMAQIKELRRALKLEQEKRKSEWNEYQKTVAAIR